MPIRVAVYAEAGHPHGAGPQNLERILAPPDFAVVFLTPQEIIQGIAPKFEVIMFPGGTGPRQANALGEEGRQAVRGFVESGGGYVGICAGAWLARNAPNRLGLVDVEFSFARDGRSYRGQQRQVILRVSGDREAREVFQEFAAPTHEYMKYVMATYRNGPMFGPRRRGRNAAPVATLCTFVQDYWGIRPGKDQRVEEGAGAAIAGRYGKGRVVLFSPHFESDKTPELHPYVIRAVQWAAGRGRVLVRGAGNP